MPRSKKLTDAERAKILALPKICDMILPDGGTADVLIGPGDIAQRFRKGEALAQEKSPFYRAVNTYSAQPFVVPAGDTFVTHANTFAHWHSHERRELIEAERDKRPRIAGRFVKKKL